jgi:tRNA-2-methylthio-N6-dimethylallyladenosine synthase
VLDAMKRRHTRAEYLATIARIRDARPDMAMSGDFIVGFPGETDAEFEETLSIVREVGYASAFSFKYSPRPGTPGALLEDQVAEEVKVERLAKLNAEILAQQVAFAKSCEGKILPVLVEKPGRNPGQLGGRSPYLQAVHMDGPARLIGTIQPVEIVKANNNSLSGRVVTQPERMSASLVESEAYA